MGWDPFRKRLSIFCKNIIQSGQLRYGGIGNFKISDMTIGFIGQGEKAWDAFARPCQVFLEYTNRNTDKVYCFRRKGLAL